MAWLSLKQETKWAEVEVDDETSGTLRNTLGTQLCFVARYREKLIAVCSGLQLGKFSKYLKMQNSKAEELRV